MAGASSMSRWSKTCLCCLSDGVPKRSLLVAAVVGSLLNLINQGDALFGSGPVQVWKLALTYAVPYCVATYGAVSFRLRQQIESKRLPDPAPAKAAGAAGERHVSHV